MRNMLILFSLCCFSGSGAFAQGENITLKYFGLTFHPFGDQLAEVQPYKLDKNAYVVFNFGAMLGYEHYIWEDILSYKLIQSAFTDCSGGSAGFTYLGLKGICLDKKKHRLMFDIGPVFFYRQSWTRFPQYTDRGIFQRYKDYQYKFFWYGAEFEYDYRLTDKLDLSVSFTPGLPFVLTWATGVKYWLNKDFRIRE